MILGRARAGTHARRERERERWGEEDELNLFRLYLVRIVEIIREIRVLYLLRSFTVRKYCDFLGWFEISLPSISQSSR